MKLSALDLSPIASGSSARQALERSIDLARHVESLGLERIWFAEHHNAASVASSSPEIMIAATLARTDRIRVGSGGIMLPNHAPLKVAETFRVLECLHPGRVDLGVGRAAGTDPKTAMALRQARELLGAEGFEEQLDQLLSFLTRDPDPSARFGPIKAVPIGVPPPTFFLLGGGVESARLAARLGAQYAYAHHISPADYVASLTTYRREFRASRWAAAPYSILAVSVICARDAARALELSRAAELGFVRFGQGLRDLPMPSVEEARAYTFDSEEEVFRRAAHDRFVCGSPAETREILTNMMTRSRADELMVLTHVHDHDERKRSYELLHEALG